MKIATLKAALCIVPFFIVGYVGYHTGHELAGQESQSMSGPTDAQPPQIFAADSPASTQPTEPVTDPVKAPELGQPEQKTETRPADVKPTDQAPNTPPPTEPPAGSGYNAAALDTSAADASKILELVDETLIVIEGPAREQVLQRLKAIRDRSAR